MELLVFRASRSSVRGSTRSRGVAILGALAVLAIGPEVWAQSPPAYEPPGQLPTRAGDAFTAMPPAIEPSPDSPVRLISFPSQLDPGEPPIASGGDTADILNGLDAGEPIDGDDDIAERLEAIEKRLAKADAATTKKQDADSKKPSLKWSGRVQSDFWGFPYTDAGANAFENGDPLESVRDRFLFRRVRIGVAGDIADNMLYRFDIEFGIPNSPTIKDGFVGFEELPVLQTVLIGHQKRPYSLDLINSSNVNFFLERPDVADAFNPDSRRYGVQSWAFSEDLTYNWRYGVFLGQDLQNVGTVFATPVNEDLQGEVAGRFASTYFYDEPSGGRYYGHWAVSGAIASPDGDDPANNTARFRSRPEARTTDRWIDTGPIDGAHTYELLGFEYLLNLGPFQAVAEYQQAWVQRDAGFDEVTFNGAYGYVSYVLTGEHIAWDRETGQLGRLKPFENFFLVRTSDGCLGSGWGAWEVCARYSYCDLTDEDIEGGVSNEVTLGMNWYWNEWSRLQFNYIHGNIAHHAPVAGETEANFDIVGMRFAMFF